MTSLTLGAESLAASLPPSVLEWVPGRIVTDCARPRIESALRQAEAAVKPIDPMQLGDGLLTLLRVWPTPNGWNPEAAMAGYVEVLGDLPADLFVVARSKTMRTCHRLPSPAQILEPVLGEWRARLKIVRQLKWLLASDAIEQRKPLSPADREAALLLLDRARKQMGGAMRKKAGPARRVEMDDAERERLLDRIGAPKTEEEAMARVAMKRSA